MVKTIRHLTPFFAVACLLAAPAAAEIYTLTLANGETIDSRHRPMIAPWDEGKILLQTDVGNWVSLPKAEITDVRVDVEAAGYGRVIDGTTVDMGLTANDRPATGSRPSPEEQLLEFVRSQQRERPVYDTQQFVDPSETSGIPVWMTDRTTPPLGLVNPRRPAPSNPPQPAPSAPTPPAPVDSSQPEPMSP